MIKTLKEIAFHAKVKIGYALAFILLLVSFILIFYNNNRLIRQADWVSNTNHVIINLETLISGVIDGETAVRGFIATSDSSFLQPYNNSLGIVNHTLLQIKEETEDDQVQQENIKTLTGLIAEQDESLQYIISSFKKDRQSFNDSLFKSFYTGKLLRDRTRALVKNMQAHEQVLLLSRRQALDAKYVALNFIIIASLIITLLIGFMGLYTYMKEYKARLLSDEEAKRSHKELQKRVLELDEVNKDLLTMKRSEKFASTGRIARTIAHEVRNPLTNIDLAVSQIKSELPDSDESIVMLFDMVKRNSGRINQLISELLNATRFIELTTAVASINVLLDEALQLAGDRIELSGIKIEKRYSADICNVKVDTEKIKLAFLNLIVNAIEAMDPHKGLLKIETRAEDNKCVVEITDNGSGMTEEQLGKVFEPYFTTKASGNGLGLANTANIILNHQGDINVISRPGEGTTFTIKFDFSNDD